MRSAVSHVLHDGLENTIALKTNSVGCNDKYFTDALEQDKDLTASAWISPRQHLILGRKSGGRKYLRGS